MYRCPCRAATSLRDLTAAGVGIRARRRRSRRRRTGTPGRARWHRRPPRPRRCAVFHHDHPVAQLEGVGHVLFDDEQRGARRVQLRQRFVRAVDDRRGEAEREFVGDQQLRRVDEHAGHRQHPLLAAGQRAGDLGTALVESREQLEGLVEAGADAFAAPDPVDRQDEVLLDRECAEHRAALRERGRRRRVRTRTPACPSRRRRRPRSCRTFGAISPEATRAIVVLPAPFGPTSATASPASIESDTSNSARKAP